jgi:hypothetical protein
VENSVAAERDEECNYGEDNDPYIYTDTSRVYSCEGAATNNAVNDYEPCDGSKVEYNWDRDTKKSGKSLAIHK